MIFPFGWALALALPLVTAFQNTSPLFLATTLKLDISNIPTSLQTTSQLLSKIQSTLIPACRSDYYVLISHPGAALTDFDAYVLPFTHRLLSSGGAGDKLAGRIQSSVAVREVFGNFDMDALGSALESSCGSDLVGIDKNGYVDFSLLSETKSHILRWDLSELSSGPNRSSQLGARDRILETLLLSLPRGRSFTIVYSATPLLMHDGSPVDESNPDGRDIYSFPAGLRAQLRRGEAVGSEENKGTGNTSNSKAALFGKYSFLGPGLIMGLIATFIFFLVVYSAVSALSSVQPSYFAFGKHANSDDTKKNR